MKKLFAIIAFLALAAFSLRSETVSTVQAICREEEGSVTYLLCGYDDAANNTDAIVLANYSYATNTMTFLQIPRDTYCKSVPYSKINSLYPVARSSGSTDLEALTALKDALSESLGIRIDGCIGCRMSTFAKMIDAIGGVTLTLKAPLKISLPDGSTALELSGGENHLNGVAALTFVRARSGYITGDLGRMDAQKIFLSAFMKTLKYDVGIADIVKACIATGDGWTVDAKIGDLFKIIAKNRGRISNITTKYVNLPGAQVESSEGIWYYSMSRHATDNLLSESGFVRTGGIDPSGILKNDADPAFVKIYDSHEIRARVYDDSSLAEVDVGAR